MAPNYDEPESEEQRPTMKKTTRFELVVTQEIFADDDEFDSDQVVAENIRTSIEEMPYSVDILSAEERP